MTEEKPEAVGPPVDDDEAEAVSSAASTRASAREQDKAQRIEREKQELLASLAGADFSTQRARVAMVLNLFPHTRNSDVSLALKYWEMFQPDVYNRHGILPTDLFKLERQTTITRARAKIQNEYGLFQADSDVQRRRRGLEDEIKEAVVEDAAPRRVISVFADETGKNHDYVIVAAVWVLTGYAVFDITRAIERWKATSSWATREVHFAKFGKADAAPLSEYLGVIQNNREFLSLKVIAIEKARTRRSIEEVVAKLHEQMLIRGAEHEISTGRIDLPREIEVTIDEEQSLDTFARSEMKTRINADFAASHSGELTLSKVETVSSRISALVQLADLVAGAHNRRLNHHGERNYKDDMADQIIDYLGLTLAPSAFPELDASALFRI